MSTLTKVLIVDDNPVDREAVARLLSHAYQCIGASTGREGVELCHRAAPKCVILDYRLPDHDGLVWLPRFIDENVGVVMLTGVGDESVAAASMRGGAHDYLTKDSLTRESLERAIRNAVDKVELRQELELHRKVVSHMPLGLAVCRWEDRDDLGSFRFLWQNPAADRVADTSHVGRTLGEAFPSLLRTAVPTLCAEAIRSGEPQHLPELRSAEKRVFTVRTAPLGSDLVAILLEDISVQTEALEEREKMEAQMRAAQRMEAIGRLAGGVAHDFNNLLTVIQSYAGFVREQFQDADPAREDVDVILDATERAARLTNQLLSFSRRQIQELVTHDVNDTLRGVERMLERLIGDDVELVTVLEPSIGLVRIDPAHLEQVIVNLAVNARDAMPQGGTLIFETHNVVLDARYAAKKATQIPPGRYTMIAVSDTGSGIDEETLEHIFEPFFTTKGAERGSGLGLSTVFGIVKQSKGHIWVYSEVGRGTTFKLYFPQVVDATESAPPRPERTTLTGSETVLVVEDDTYVRNAACRTLRAHGYRVLEAAHGAQALEVAEHHAGGIDILVTDVVMPQMSGRELADRLVAQRPALRVLYVSGYTENAIVHHQVLEEGIVLLPKPFTPEALVRKVREVLDA